LLVWLGILLFLNLIKLDLIDLVSVFVKPTTIIVLSIVKVAVIPLILYSVTSVFYPSQSLSVLLLSGISTGLGAPFVISFVGGRRLHLVIGMIIVTSLLVPFTLPSVVYWLFNKHFSIPLSNMIIYGLSGYGIQAILISVCNRKGKSIMNKNEIKGDLISSFISLSYINNVLVAIFAQQFFGPKVAALAAFYNIPYYIGIVLKNAGNLNRKRAKSVN
jgi:bile acid:Na+ symporter, BASS family